MFREAKSKALEARSKKEVEKGLRGCFSDDATPGLSMSENEIRNVNTILDAGHGMLKKTRQRMDKLNSRLQMMLAPSEVRP